MKKSDLKSRMVVEFRNGSRKMVVIDEEEGMLFLGKDRWMSDEFMNDDMIHSDKLLEEFDIMKVFEPVHGFKNVSKTQKLIWERKEYYNGKIICYEENGSSFFTKGKVYEVKNGVIISDDGLNSREFKTLDEINDNLVPDFIEYKG